mmetsp:Transcript_12967/g.29860  ORF Transcript_12967/g.29860 Transcript_12967/m.29860 type:complete len:284 (-) Transcript_12967:17-868(-)
MMAVGACILNSTTISPVTLGVRVSVWVIQTESTSFSLASAAALTFFVYSSSTAWISFSARRVSSFVGSALACFIAACRAERRTLFAWSASFLTCFEIAVLASLVGLGTTSLMIRPCTSGAICNSAASIALATAGTSAVSKTLTCSELADCTSTLAVADSGNASPLGCLTCIASSMFGVARPACSTANSFCICCTALTIAAERPSMSTLTKPSPLSLLTPSSPLPLTFFTFFAFLANQRRRHGCAVRRSVPAGCVCCEDGGIESNSAKVRVVTLRMGAQPHRGR